MLPVYSLQRTSDPADQLGNAVAEVKHALKVHATSVSGPLAMWQTSISISLNLWQPGPAKQANLQTAFA